VRRQEHKQNTADARPGVSAVIPALNAARALGKTVATIAWAAEIIVADGGSTDGTAEAASLHGARVVTTPCGRGTQLAAGVAAASHVWLLLLHADTSLAPEAEAAARTHMLHHPDRAGYFRFALNSADRRARRLEHFVAWRCRVLALPYGDQGLLVHRDLLRSVGGVRPLPLMEDVDLVRRLGRRRLVALDAAAITSAAKWERDGWLRRSARNLCCLSLWFAGVAPHRIARIYR
jgi:rSAM/selenodomain-associated transferase 2